MVAKSWSTAKIPASTKPINLILPSTQSNYGRAMPVLAERKRSKEQSSQLRSSSKLEKENSRNVSMSQDSIVAFIEHAVKGGQSLDSPKIVDKKKRNPFLNKSQQKLSVDAGLATKKKAMSTQMPRVAVS